MLVPWGTHLNEEQKLSQFYGKQTLINNFESYQTFHVILLTRFDPSGLDDSEPRMSFTVFANTTSNQVAPQQNIVLTTNVVIQADLSITG